MGCVRSGLAKGANANVYVSCMANGLMRIYDAKQGQILAEIQGHSRAINTIDVHPSQSKFITAGDDTYVNEWSL